MKIELFDNAIKDEVLGALYWVGKTDYEFAIEKLFPLVQRLEIQRGLQDPGFYARLRKDLREGCVVPPITLAFIEKEKTLEVNDDYINSHIEQGFILDGIQRLSAIRRAFEEVETEEQKEVFLSRTLHLNIIASPSMDKLLYRMITLNNGQKPMSPRHQIDILSETMFDFDSLTLRSQTHKDRQQAVNRLAVHRSDIIKGYIAYLSNSTAIDNKLVIEEKMDQLIAERIIDSEVSKEKYEFMDVLRWVSMLSEEQEVGKWFALSNNFIGCCVAARSGFEFLSRLNVESFAEQVSRFEDVFSSFDRRKIKVGDFRRKMVAEYFGDLARYSTLSMPDVILEISQ